MRGAFQVRDAVRAVLILGLLGLAPVLSPAQEHPENVEYLRWLESHSMLAQAEKAVVALKNQGESWRQPYAEPRPEKVVQETSTWILMYPGSVIARPGQSIIAAWAEPELWDALHELGIDLLHTGPIQRAGGLRGHDHTPSVDGGFDPISLEIDPGLGTEDEYRRLVQVAGAHGGSIAGDLVPLHTGKGADFLLALRAYQDYPSMYVLAEIKKEDWELLPKVSSPWESAPLPLGAARTPRWAWLHPRDHPFQRRQQRRPATDGLGCHRRRRGRRRPDATLGLPSFLQAGPAHTQLAASLGRGAAGGRRQPRAAPRWPRRPWGEA